MGLPALAACSDARRLGAVGAKDNNNKNNNKINSVTRSKRSLPFFELLSRLVVAVVADAADALLGGREVWRAAAAFGAHMQHGRQTPLRRGSAADILSRRFAQPLPFLLLPTELE